MTIRDARKEEAAGSPPVGKDLVVAAGPTADNKGAVVLRAREGRVEVGELRPLEDGKPITGELLRLRPTPKHPHVFQVEEAIELPGTKPSATGRPAQVASDRYRANWEAIYGRKDALN